MSTKEMLEELALNNVLIKQLSGNVDFLALKSRDIVEAVWRIFKNNHVINDTELHPNYLNLVENGRTPQNLLELEIYCQKNTTIN